VLTYLGAKLVSEAIIIGAGPAGLSAAFELLKLGVRPTILEAETQVGGLSRTLNHRGYRFDIGGHRFFSKVQIINDLWKEILAEDFLHRKRLSRIYYRGRFFDYPLRATNALVGLGPFEALRVIASYATSQLFPEKEEENFEQWVSNRFGRRLYEIFFRTYTEKVWGLPCAKISADWAAQRIKNLSLPHALRNAIFGSGRTQEGRIITSLVDTFHYPRLGPGMMWERCQQLVDARGAVTHLGVSVDRVRHCRGRVEYIQGQTRTGKRAEWGGTSFLSSMPLRQLVQVLDPAPPGDVLEAAMQLSYRDYLTVVLIVKREHIFPDNWLYIHSPSVMAGRVQNYKNWSPEMVPDRSRTSLGLEYFLSNRHEMWRWSDDRLVELAVRECAQLGLVEPGEVEEGIVVRVSKAYPVYERNYRLNLEKIRSFLQTITNLQTMGRNGLHRYNNQDHSMLTGIQAARNIIGERNDLWSVNTDTEYLEEYRVWDRSVPMRRTPVMLQSRAGQFGNTDNGL
jgi:protoporphyrinogen oxidase